MKILFLKLFLVGIFLVVSVPPLKAEAQDVVIAAKNKQCMTQSMVQLKESLRKLWTDHVVWTRNYIVSAVGGHDDQAKVLARLLQNQQDIGDAIKPYYGEAAGNKLAELLKEHILIAGKIVEAAKNGNQPDVEKYNIDWHRNADDMAKLLSSANPNWSEKVLKELLYMHLQLVTDAATARIKKDWDADIQAFDKGEAHILVLADTLTKGIIQQFPDRFK